MTTRAEWAELIDRLERSGLDAAEFARCEGLELAQLEGWLQKLRAPRLHRAEPQSQPARVATLAPPTPPTSPAPEWVDIRLPDGGLVRLVPELDAATAACVLAVAAELLSGRPREPHTSNRSGGGKK